MLETGQAYIGKRQYHKAKGRIKGCPKRRVVDVGSPQWNPKCWGPMEWEHYKGSSKYLHKFMRENPKYTYTYTILRNCRSRGILLYAEAEEQWKCQVLIDRLPNGTHRYFNHQIGGIRFRPPLVCTEETKKKISLATKGKALSEEAKANISKSLKGRVFSEDHKAKLSEKARGNTATLGRKRPQEEIDTVAKANTGRKHTAEARSNMRAGQRKDTTVYTFVHKDGETFTGTRYDFTEKHDVPRLYLDAVLTGRQKTTKGWRLKT